MVDVTQAMQCSPRSTVVRSAWDATLFAERLGGWPIVLRPDGSDGGVAFHVDTPAEAAALLERGDGAAWVAEERLAPDAASTRQVGDR